MPRLRNSAAVARENASCACFDAEYGPAGAKATVPATETIGVGAQLVVSADMDVDLVYAITRSLWDPRNGTVLDGGTPSGRRIRLQSALDGLDATAMPDDWRSNNRSILRVVADLQYEAAVNLDSRQG